MRATPIVPERALLVALILGACTPTEREIPPVDNVVEVASFPATPSRDLDLIVQMDDSGSTHLLRLRADPDACPESTDHARVVVTREPPADGTHVEVRCET